MPEYTAKATTAGHNGHVGTDGGLIHLDLTVSKELNAPGKTTRGNVDAKIEVV